MAIRLIALLAAIPSCGMQPVLSTHHISDPRVSNDSFEYSCLGLEHEWGKVTIRGDGCVNHLRSRRHSEFAHVSLEYRP